MVVIVLERTPASVRGELTRWMLELHAGVFVGNMSAMVRDKLWELVVNGQVKVPADGQVRVPAPGHMNVPALC